MQNFGIPLGNDLSFAKFNKQGVFPMQFLALNEIFNSGLHTKRKPGVPWHTLAFANFKILDIIPTQYSSMYMIFNVLIQNSIISGIFLALSGTLEFLWKWLVFNQVLQRGYFSHSIFSPKFRTKCRIPKLQHFRNLLS